MANNLHTLYMTFYRVKQLNKPTGSIINLFKYIISLQLNVSLYILFILGI